jgi:hypothetical protein
LKGFLIFCGVILTLGFIWLAQPYLNARDREYEQRFIGALNFTEDTVEAERGLHRGIYEPSIAPGPNPDYWVVSGIMVSGDNWGGTTREPISAVLENVCAKSFDLSCWRMVEFAIDSPAVEALPLSGFTLETVAEDIASGVATRGDTFEEDAAPAAEVLIANEAAATPSEPVAGADVDGGESSLAPGDAGYLKQELVRFIQNALRRLRYEPGPIDGKLGSRTASAIRAYQRDFNLSPDGRPSVELFRHLRGQINEQHSHDPSNNGDQPEG